MCEKTQPRDRADLCGGDIHRHSEKHCCDSLLYLHVDWSGRRRRVVCIVWCVYVCEGFIASDSLISHVAGSNISPDFSRGSPDCSGSSVVAGAHDSRVAKILWQQEGGASSILVESMGLLSILLTTRPLRRMLHPLRSPSVVRLPMLFSDSLR